MRIPVFTEKGIFFLLIKFACYCETQEILKKYQIYQLLNLHVIVKHNNIVNCCEQQYCETQYQSKLLKIYESKSNVLKIYQICMLLRNTRIQQKLKKLSNL